MSVRFIRKWVTDDSGEHLRVVMLDDEQPGEAEVCRLVPGRTDDRAGCVLRAVQVCEAMSLLADHQRRAMTPRPDHPNPADPANPPEQNLPPAGPAHL